MSQPPSVSDAAVATLVVLATILGIALWALPKLPSLARALTLPLGY